MKNISFVIPCYGSEETIEHVVDEIINTVSKRMDYKYEIICINDSSPDDVLSVLKKITKNNSNIKVVDLARNFGKHSAVMAGYSIASGDIVVNLDDDGQCPVDRLWELIDPLVEDKADMSMAYYPKNKQSFLKNIGSHINSLMSRILINKPKDLKFSNFNAKKKYLVEEMIRYNNPYPYLEGLVLRTTSRIISVPMEERERVAGKGNYTLRKSISLWINGFTAFSVKPLRIATFIGLICAFLGFISGIVVIVKKIIHPSVVMGYSSTVAIILFIGGMLMLMLGLIGEYIGRIYISINNSPQYVIRDTINVSKRDE